MTKLFERLEGYMLLSADAESDPITTMGMNRVSIQCITDNTNAVGELKLQLSNDGSNWNDGYFQLDGNTTQMDGYSFTEAMPFNRCLFHEVFTGFVKLTYTSTSGTGGLNYIIHKKRV